MDKDPQRSPWIRLGGSITSAVNVGTLAWLAACASSAGCGTSSPDSAERDAVDTPAEGAVPGVASKRRLLAVHLAEGWNCEGYGGLPSSGNCWREMEVATGDVGAFTCGRYEECVAVEAGSTCPASAGGQRYNYSGCAREGVPSSDFGSRYSIGDNQGREVFPIGEAEFQTVADIVESEAFELAWAGGRDECLAGHLEGNLAITVLWDDGQEEAFLHAAQCLSTPDHVYSQLFNAFGELRQDRLYCKNSNEMIPSAEELAATRGACIPCGGTC